MAVLNGYKAIAVDGIANGSAISTNLSSFALDNWPPHYNYQGFLASTPITRNYPVQANGRSISGTLQQSFSNDFYYRVHITPSPLDVGNVSTQQVRNVEVWNAYLTPQFFSAFSATAADGISVSAPQTPPYTFPALKSLTYSFTISNLGPADINASYTWTIAGKQSTLKITGRRAIVFPFAPNFDDDFTESLEWKTDILRAYDGSEQRRALRTKARRSFEYKYLLKSTDQQIFQNILWGWQNRAYLLPVWSDIVRVTAAVNIGDLTINANPTNLSFFPATSAVLFKDASNYEVVDIDTLSTTIKLSRATTKAWPVGTAVFPVVAGYVEESVSISRMTDNVMSGSVRFKTSPTSTDPYTPTATATTTYNSLEVITVQPNWADNIDYTFDFQRDDIDFDTGAFYVIGTELYSRNTRKFAWLLNGRSAILSFRQFLARCRGQAKTFYVPSWTNDFTVIADIGSGTTTLTVTDNQFRQVVGVNTAHDRIMIRMTDGSVFYRQITGVGVAGDGVNTLLSIDSALGTAYTKDKVKAVHMLHLCRLGTDKVDIVWKTNSIAQVSTTLMTVPA